MACKSFQPNIFLKKDHFLDANTRYSVSQVTPALSCKKLIFTEKNNTMNFKFRRGVEF